MKKLMIAAAIGLSAAMMASPTLAQQTTTAPAAKTDAAKLSVQTSKVSEIIKNAKAKAALEKALPEITSYYDQIGEMTLAEIAPLSEGRLSPEILKELQAEFDKV